MTDGTTLVNEQIADDERKYGKYAPLAQLSDLHLRCNNLLGKYLVEEAEADKQDAETAAPANEIDAEAIGWAVAKRSNKWEPTTRQKHVAGIVADEVTKALGKAGETKEVDRPSLERRIYDYVNSYDHVRCGETALAEVAKAANEDEEAVRDLIHEAHYLGIDSCGCVYTIPGFADTAGITSLATTIRSQRKTIARREKSIRRLMQNEGVAAERIREFEATLPNLNDTIDRRDKTIKRLDASIAGRDEMILWLRQDIIEKDELIRGLRQDVKDLIAPPPRADDTATPHQCKWWTKTMCNHPHDGHNPCYWDDDTGPPVSDCKYFEAKESAGQTGEALSETDEGAMVGAIDLYFLSHDEATIPQLAKLAQVTEKRIREYVASVDHLSFDMEPVIRLTPAVDTPQSPKGE